jgi:hypothetical protein
MRSRTSATSQIIGNPWFSVESPEGKWFKKEISGDNVPDAVMREGFDLGPVRRTSGLPGAGRLLHLLLAFDAKRRVWQGVEPAERDLFAAALAGKLRFIVKPWHRFLISTEGCRTGKIDVSIVVNCHIQTPAVTVANADAALL